MGILKGASDKKTLSESFADLDAQVAGLKKLDLDGMDIQDIRKVTNLVASIYMADAELHESLNEWKIDPKNLEEFKSRPESERVKAASEISRYELGSSSLRKEKAISVGGSAAFGGITSLGTAALAYGTGINNPLPSILAGLAAAYLVLKASFDPNSPYGYIKETRAKVEADIQKNKDRIKAYLDATLDKFRSDAYVVKEVVQSGKEAADLIMQKYNGVIEYYGKGDVEKALDKMLSKTVNADMNDEWESAWNRPIGQRQMTKQEAEIYKRGSEFDKLRYDIMHSSQFGGHYEGTKKGFSQTAKILNTYKEKLSKGRAAVASLGILIAIGSSLVAYSSFNEGRISGAVSMPTSHNIWTYIALMAVVALTITLLLKHKGKI